MAIIWNEITWLTIKVYVTAGRPILKLVLQYCLVTVRSNWLSTQAPRENDQFDKGNSALICTWFCVDLTRFMKRMVVCCEYVVFVTQKSPYTNCGVVRTLGPTASCTQRLLHLAHGVRYSWAHKKIKKRTLESICTLLQSTNDHTPNIKYLHYCLKHTTYSTTFWPDSDVTEVNTALREWGYLLGRVLWLGSWGLTLQEEL